MVLGVGQVLPAGVVQGVPQVGADVREGLRVVSGGGLHQCGLGVGANDGIDGVGQGGDRSGDHRDVLGGDLAGGEGVPQLLPGPDHPVVGVSDQRAGRVVVQGLGGADQPGGGGRVQPVRGPQPGGGRGPASLDRDPAPVQLVQHPQGGGVDPVPDLQQPAGQQPQVLGRQHVQVRGGEQVQRVVHRVDRRVNRRHRGHRRYRVHRRRVDGRIHVRKTTDHHGHNQTQETGLWTADPAVHKLARAARLRAGQGGAGDTADGSLGLHRRVVMPARIRTAG